MVVYINISELNIKLRIIFNQELNRLYIIIIDYLFLFRIKSDFLKEFLLLN